MWESIIAVVGTLTGAVVAGLLQQRAARAERLEGRAAARSSEGLTAVTTLVAALADHRRAMYLREELRLTGAAPEQVAAARAASHETRAVVSAPHAAVAVLLPALADLTETTVQQTYSLRNAASLAALNTARQNAADSADRLLRAARIHLG